MKQACQIGRKFSLPVTIRMSGHRYGQYLPAWCRPATGNDNSEEFAEFASSFLKK
jgi:hypothetical protein